MSKYVIGVDYGTLSGRAVIVDAKTGEEKASAVYEYPHAVMSIFPTAQSSVLTGRLNILRIILTFLQRLFPRFLKRAEFQQMMLSV